MIRTNYTDAYLIPHWVFWVSVGMLFLIGLVVILLIKDR
jgi:hypothetical protein